MFNLKESAKSQSIKLLFYSNLSFHKVFTSYPQSLYSG